MNYKSFAINTPADVRPWGAREAQVWKDIIDNVVLDCIQTTSDITGHKHYRLFDLNAVARLTITNSAQVFLSAPECAHGMTFHYPTTVFGVIEPISYTPGVGGDFGLRITGIGATKGDYGLEVVGILGDSNPDDNIAAIRFSARKKDGTTTQAIAATETAFNFANFNNVYVGINGAGNVHLYNESANAVSNILTFWKSRSGGVISGADCIGKIDFQGCTPETYAYTSVARIEAYYYGANGGQQCLRFYTNDYLAMHIEDYGGGVIVAHDLSAPLIAVDHIGQKTGGHGVAFDDNISTYGVTANGSIKATNNNFHSGTADIADDNFTSFTPGKTHGILCMSCQNTSIGCIIGYEATATPSITIIAQNGTSFEVTTGALNGTTGSDAHFTISTHTDGKIYLENRLGST